MEIMETPLDNYADGIFQPNICVDEASGNDISETDIAETDIAVTDIAETDIADTIKSKLHNVQSFLQRTIEYNKVNRIILYFNYEFWEIKDKTVNINIHDFSDILLEYYKENDYVAPVLKIIISND